VLKSQVSFLINSANFLFWPALGQKKSDLSEVPPKAGMKTVRRQPWIQVHFPLDLLGDLYGLAPAALNLFSSIPWIGTNLGEEQVSPCHQRSGMGLVGTVGPGNISHDQTADGNHLGHFQLGYHAVFVHG
jgi:hypothetical protein